MSNGKKILILGGSGFVSGHLVRQALSDGYDVWTVTRRATETDERVHCLHADRNDEDAFLKAVTEPGIVWDAVLDCICKEPQHAKQDVSVFPGLAGQLIMVSTDFVYEPDFLRFPQNEDAVRYETSGYGGNKRLCEEIFENHCPESLKWTVLRTGHIYGPGSRLGGMPKHSRDADLIEKMRNGQELELVAAGHFLQHPHFVKDFVKVMLSCIGNEKAYNQIFLTGGPCAVEARHYYEIIADILGVPLKIKEVPIEKYKAEHPEHREFLCNRVYDLTKMKQAGLYVSSTTLEDGLKEHVESLL